MSFIEAVLYGILQGVTEFLPVSSSGHLALAQKIFGSAASPDQRMAFDVFLHLATLLSVTLVYRKDVACLVRGAFSLLFRSVSSQRRKKELDFGERLTLCTLVANLPMGIALVLKDKIESVSSSLVAVGVCLVINAFVLRISDVLGRRNKKISEMTPKNALTVGFFQACAVLPGISRSGATVTGMLWQDFERPDAVRFSFLMSIPTVLVAGIIEMPAIACGVGIGWEVLVTGAVCAAISGVASIKLLSLISKKSDFRVFSYYCAIIGAAAVIFRAVNGG